MNEMRELRHNSPTGPASEGQASGGDTASRPECFVIMPISDPEGYEDGHFRRVYEDLLQPACAAAGYASRRADEVSTADIIHLDILKRLVDAPMAICDLSSRNPNVLFELGIRQAFDKPVVLVEEAGTPRIFDIAILRATPYRPSLRYHEAVEDQKKITKALLATQDGANKGTLANSIVRLLAIQKADLPEGQVASTTEMFTILMSEIRALKANGTNLTPKFVLPPKWPKPKTPDELLMVAKSKRGRRIDGIIRTVSNHDIKEIDLHSLYQFEHDLTYYLATSRDVDDLAGVCLRVITDEIASRLREPERERGADDDRLPETIEP